MSTISLKLIRRHCYIFVFYLAFYILFPLCFSLCLPIYFLRFVIAMVAKFFRPDLGKMVSTRSAVIACDSPYENPNWNLCVWLTLEGQLNFEQFRENFYRNIVLKKDKVKGNLINPEYQQYFHKWLGFLFWKLEDNFDIKDHMKYYFGEKTTTTSESDSFKGTTPEELKEILKKLTVEPFKDKRSPWEFLYIPNYMDFNRNNSQLKDQSVLIFRIHHGFCDGFTILWLLMKEVNNIDMHNVAKPTKIKNSFLTKFANVLLFLFRAPYDFMRLVVTSSDHNDWHLPIQKIHRPFNTAFTPRIPLERIKGVKNLHGCSFTSVVMAALTGAVRNAMVKKGVKVPKTMTTAIAVPMPNHPEKLRNHFIFSFITLPVGEKDPIQRLRKVENNFQRLKKSPVTYFSFCMIPVFGGLFTWMMNWFSENKFSTVLTSNFPGPPDTAYFVGGGNSNKVVDMNFTAAMGVGNVGLGFCMMSYDGGMRVISSAASSILKTDDEVEELNEKILEELKIMQHERWESTTV